MDPLWLAAWEERPRLLRIARRRSRNRSDAEEIVSEAILRVVTCPGTDLARLPALLTAVVLRLCVDRLRERTVAERNAPRLFTRPADATDDVLDRAEAVWLSAEIARLTDRERGALTARMLGLSLTETADALGVTYRAAEGLLGRARRKVRDVWARTLVILWPRRRDSWFLLAAVGTLVVVAGHAWGPSERPAPVIERAQAVRTGGTKGPGSSPRPGPAPPVRRIPQPGESTVSTGGASLTTPDLRVGLAWQEPVVVHLHPDPVQRITDCLHNGVYVETSASRVGLVCNEGRPG